MKKIFAISDIHGCDKLLTKLLETINWNEERNKDSQLIFLGDYVDKGNESLKVLKHIKQLKKDNPQNVIVLLGNHDFAWMEQANFYNELRFYSKIFNNSLSKTKAILECLNDFKYYHVQKMADKTIYFVHAGFELDKPLSEQNKEILLWARDEFFLYNKMVHQDFQNSIFVFGHTPTIYIEDIFEDKANRIKHLDNSRVLIIDNSKIDIDTGAAFIGVLSALEIAEDNNKLKFRVHSAIDPNISDEFYN